LLLQIGPCTLLALLESAYLDSLLHIPYSFISSFVIRKLFMILSKKLAGESSNKETMEYSVAILENLAIFLKELGCYEITDSWDSYVSAICHAFFNTTVSVPALGLEVKNWLSDPARDVHPGLVCLCVFLIYPMC
jgi:IS1 family transposase